MIADLRHLVGWMTNSRCEFADIHRHQHVIYLVIVVGTEGSIYFAKDPFRISSKRDWHMTRRSYTCLVRHFVDCPWAYYCNHQKTQMQNRLRRTRGCVIKMRFVMQVTLDLECTERRWIFKGLSERGTSLSLNMINYAMLFHAIVMVSIRLLY